MPNRLSPQREAEIREQRTAWGFSEDPDEAVPYEMLDDLLREFDRVRAERDAAQAETVRLAGLLGERGAELESLRGKAAAADGYYRQIKEQAEELNQLRRELERRRGGRLPRVSLEEQAARETDPARRAALRMIGQPAHFGSCGTNSSGHRLVNGHCVYCGTPSAEAGDR
ncbi:hypothetical protein C9F11_37880 [Streptomyces sp. YIM 121038]|uniref:hypothetical protein n=1 Tax=Streptomyces sp. YIM 121038 TaxID=2136401 RepID=UPI001110CEFD|nr:hypothetical protein [Streptomyces sp. YIM 121038]QCX81159.1 hypothetical protein C9F11_37880 [Streptomyces sp. YIM 121038]